MTNSLGPRIRILNGMRSVRLGAAACVLVAVSVGCSERAQHGGVRSPLWTLTIETHVDGTRSITVDGDPVGSSV